MIKPSAQLFVGFIALGALSCSTASNVPTAPGATQPQTIDQFELMGVCTDATGNTIQQGVTPLDPACEHLRQIRPGEFPPYHLSPFVVTNPRPTVTISLDTVPVTVGSTTLSVTYFHRSPTPVAQDVSIQSFDSNYGFIMGSWSPSAFSTFNSTVATCTSTPTLRFNEGWTVSSYIVPSLNQTGYNVFEGNIVADPYPSAGSGSSLPCPTANHAGFASWTTGSVTFGSATPSTQKTMVAVVGNHFSNGDTTTSSPGAAEQLERTYWTQQLGLTRWEHWARSDWTDNGESAEAYSIALFAKGTCSVPYREPAVVSPGFSMGDVTASSSTGYSEVYTIQGVTDPATGASYTWFMTDCDDYTNLVLEPNPHNPGSGFNVDTIFWNP